MSVYPFIEAEKAEQHGNVAKACQLLGVSRSAFYEWHKHEPSARELADDELGDEIQEVYDQSRCTYGWPRVWAQLRRQGICVSRKRVARIMRQRALVGRCRRRRTRTTISDPDLTGAVDRLKRAFGPGTIEVDRVYVGDITYIRTWQGWTYLATVIDLASRRVVGWAVADHLRAELVGDALNMAITHRRPAPGVIFHSDRGTQYTSTEYVELINDAAAVASARAADITAQGILTEDSTPQEIEAGLERVLEELRIPLQQSVDAIDPPEQVAELHTLLWSWHADFIEIETTLAARMGATPDTEEGWTMLSDSPEVVAYRASLAEGKQVCIDFQAQLDATEARGAFEGTPWLPNELSEVVNAALGCEAFPEDPQSVYRYPPP